MSGLYLRTSAKVRALHLNRDAQPADIADFVSRVAVDFDVQIKPSSIVLVARAEGFKLDAVVGDWLVIDKGQLAVWGNDEFNSIHEYLAP